MRTSTTSNHENRASSLGQALDRHFLACAAVATAGFAAAAGSADAAVQYSGLLDIAIDPSTPYGVYLDVNNLSTAVDSDLLPGWDLNIYNVNQPSGRKIVRNLTPDKAGAPTRFAAPVGQQSANGQYSYISKLGAGVTVGSASTFITPVGVPYSGFAYRDPTNGYDQTMWNGGVTDGFMGFKFTDDAGQNHFGWARLNITPFSSGPEGYNVTLRDFAFESTPNASIATGAGIPEPSGLALAVLALGAAGIRPKRKAPAA